MLQKKQQNVFFKKKIWILKKNSDTERPISYWIISKLKTPNTHIILEKPKIFFMLFFMLALYQFEWFFLFKFSDNSRKSEF